MVGVPSAVICATSTSPARTPAGRGIATSVTAVRLSAVVEAPAETAPEGVGADVTVTVCENGALAPAALLTVRATVYVPGAVNVCEGCCVVAFVPSPKSQAHDVGPPVEVSPNCTGRGAVPLAGDAVKLAVGATAGAPVSGTSACQYRCVVFSLARTTRPVAAETLCLVEVASFIVGLATSRITGVPRPAAKTGSAI